MRYFLNIFCALCIGAVSFTAAAAEGMVAFVANDDELNVALDLAQSGTIKSVAISEKFYQESAKQTKDRIRGLIARADELGDRPVYWYGNPIDLAFARMVLGIAESTVDCGRGTPFLYMRIFSVERNMSKMEECGTLNDPARDGTEEEMRSFISRDVTDFIQ